MSEPAPAESADHVAQLIDDLDPGAFVTRWVVVAEVISSDGKRDLWSDMSEDATHWDALGMLEYALHAAKVALQVALEAEADDE